MKIFVQIASYRDPQLIPTLDSMLENAKRPKNLRIGICRQYHPEDGFDNLEKFSGDKRFRVKDVLYSEAKTSFSSCSLFFCVFIVFIAF